MVRTIALLVGVFVCLLLVGSLVAPTLRAGATALFSPLWSAHKQGGSALLTFFTYVRGKHALVKETEALRLEVADLRVRLIDRNTLYQETLSLKERLGRQAAPHVVLAGVLVRPPQTPYDTLLIDAGSVQGIAVGDRVSAGGTTLIGKVSEVRERSAMVSLFSSPGNVFDAFLRGTIPISVEAKGGGTLRAQVPYDAQAVEGDPVSIPSIEANTAFIVEYVETVPGDSSVIVHLRLPVAPSQLSNVEIWVSK